MSVPVPHDGDCFRDIGYHMVGTVSVPWPRSPIDSDRTKSGRLPALDVSDEVVIDHPSALGRAALIDVR